MKTRRRRRRKGSRSFWRSKQADPPALGHLRGRGLRLEPLEDRRLLSNSPPVAVDDGYVTGQDETLSVTGLPEEMLTVSLRAEDLEYDSLSGMFYAAVGSDGGARANSLTEIDPVSATLGNSVFIPGEPKKLLVTDDGQYAYATVSSGQEIQRFNLPSETADMKFAMPSGRSVESMDVIPGWSEAIVVSRKHDGYSPRHGGVAVYENGVALPNETPGFLGAGGPNILTVDETGTKAYGYQNELSSFTFYELEIDASGVQITDTHHGVLSGYGIPKIEYEDGRIYAYTGEVIDVDTLTTVGNFPGHRHYVADSETGRLYTLTTSGSTAIIETYNLANMVKMDTLEIPGMSGSAGDIIRFGERGLAFRDLENVYFLQTNVVPHGGQYGVLENDEDADGDLLTAFVVDGPDHGDLKLNTDGSFTYTPESGFLDVDTFTYEVTDGQAVSNVATVTINVNGPPVANPDGPYVVDEGQTLVVDVSTTLIAESGFNDQAGIHSDPTPDSPYQLGETIHDLSDLEPGWADTWVVSAGGGAGGYHRAKAMADDPWEGDGALYIQETDPSDPTWVYRVWDTASSELVLIEQYVRLPANGSLHSRPGQGGTGNLIAADWKANSDGTFSVRDGDGQGGGDFEPTGLTWQPMQWFKVSTLIDRATDTYEFYVNGQKYDASDPLGFRGTPSLIDRVEYLTPTEAWVDEVRVYSVDASGEVGVLENDSDPNADPLTAVLVAGPSHGSLTLLPNGSFTYTPEHGFAGVDTFTYKASDGLLESNVATVTIEVEGLWSEYRNSVMLDDPFAYYRLGEAAGATTAVDETGNHDGTYVNDPTLEVPGAILSDPHETAAGFDPSANQYVELTTMGDYGSRLVDGFTIEYWARFRDSTTYQRVLGVANDGSNTALVIDIADHEPNELRLFLRDDDRNRYEARFSPQGDNVNIYDGAWHHVVHVFDPSTAALADRVVYYVDGLRQDVPVTLAGGTPDNSSDFAYPMTLGVWNSRGDVHDFFQGDLDEAAFYTRPLSWAEVNAHHGVAVGNHVPMAIDDAYYVDENTPLDVPVGSGLLINDSDADGDPLEAILVSAPSHGALALAGDGSFVYTPDADFRGVDTFTYKATDGEADSNVATVLIGVSPDVVVNSTADPGDGIPDVTETTLREAIDAANAIPGTQTIVFDVPTSDPGYDPVTGAFTIQPCFALPEITDPVVIDGYSQPGASPNTNPTTQGLNAVLKIELDGSLAGADASGLMVAAHKSATIRGLVINRFSAHGIVLEASYRSAIEGNFIGTDVSGTVALGNAQCGVVIQDHTFWNRIGTNGDGLFDEAERNVISANASHGVLISGDVASSNVVAGNLIGTDVTGTLALGNGSGGEGGAGIAICGEAGSNRIGTDGDGVADVSERNVVSANGGSGIQIVGSGATSNVVAGNLIGTDVSGTVALGNAESGVLIRDGSSMNRIGTNGDGRADEVERNVISGNASHGVLIARYSGDNVVAGNYVGIDASGTAALGNGYGVEPGAGIAIADRATDNRIGTNGDGLADAAERNVIAANCSHGVMLTLGSTDRNVVAGNYIGTDSTGAEALGNGGHGVYITSGAWSNTIGGDGASGNLIAWNAGVGVAVVNHSTGNRVQANSIHDNGGLGIDLGDDGVTPNDPEEEDWGPNELQNYPVIAAAAFGLVTRVSGTLHSARNAEYTLDFYANSEADPSGYGEGERWLGSTVVTTDASGSAAFNVVLPSATYLGELITGTATAGYPEHNTSEFSAAVSADAGEPWAAYRDVVMSDEPFAYYRLGEAAGATTAVDEIGVHHGTYVNDPTLEVPGAILADPDDTAARFDATQYVEGTTMADYGSRMIDGFTIECWVRLSVPTDWSNILGTANPGYTTNVQLSVDETRSMRLYFRDDDWDRYSVWFYSEGDNAEIFDQEWHHLVFAYDPTPANPSDRFDLYIDSVPQELEVQPGNDRPDGTSDFVYPMILGGWHQRGTVVPTYDGDLDEVAFYTRPLSWTEAGEHYGVAVGNHVPMAVDDAYYVEENTLLAVTVESGLLANDSDADGDPLVVVSVVRYPSHGALTLDDDGSLIYVPAPDFRGVDTFTYRATDGEADSNVATVLIGVSPDVVVNSTADPGDGTPDAAETTLREAIDAANAIPGTQTILFDIPTSDPGYDAGTGAFTIQPLSALPEITDSVVLDAWTQPGFAGSPVIELDGSQAGTDGLVITTDNSTVRGLVINRFSGNGIVLDGASHNAIEGNYIGTDVSGTVALGNGTHGVWIHGGAQYNRIGTNGDGVADEAERNVISANTYDGVVIIGAGVDFNVVAGNYIGTDASGNAALGNGRFGVNVGNGARSNRIGTDGDGVADEAERNVVSANASHGVVIHGAGTDSNVLAGNYIGTDVSGTVALGNGFGVQAGYGLVIYSGAQSNRIGTNGDGVADAAERNVISGNSDHGLAIEDLGSDHNIVAGNFIGTDAAGTIALGNGAHGVVIMNNGQGGPQANLIGTDGDGIADEAERNVISANTYEGVVILGTGTDFNVVAGNYIGTDASGNAALGNGRFGVNVGNGARSNRIGTDGDGVADEAERNVVSANASHGVVIHGAGTDSNVLAGNYIGTDVSGTVALGNGFGVEWGYGVVIQSGAQSNRVGTNGDGVADASERNVISANADRGVTIWGTGTDGNVVAGNYIGTDASGTNALGNGDHGVYITDWKGAPQANLIGTNGDGIADEAERNVISANALDGVHIRGAGTNFNVVAGNYIGTDVSGTVALGNARYGVSIIDGAAANRIGTDGDGIADEAERNVISANADEGVAIAGEGTNHNVVAGNYIGTDVTGTAALGNGFGVEFGSGLWIGQGAQYNLVGTNGDGVADEAERNVISANHTHGVILHSTDTKHNVVAGNFIGTDVTGTAALGNGAGGVTLHDWDGPASENLIGTDGDGVADEAERNVISGNTLGGIRVGGEGTDSNVVAGNFIGTDVTGTVALGNGSYGVKIDNGAQANLIGTDGDGVADTAERNIISGNVADGVYIEGAGTDFNVAAGNFIGTDATGTAALGNGGNGVRVDGGAESNRIGIGEVFHEVGGQVVVEAETYSARRGSDGREWLVVPGEDPGDPAHAHYRGAGFIQALPDTGGLLTDPLGAPGPFVDYRIQIDTPGDYQLYVRWDSHDYGSDSFYARIVELGDGPGGSVADWYRWSGFGGPVDADFATDPWAGSAAFEGASGGGGDVPAVWSIAAPGQYTLRFLMRESGAAIDTFVLQLAGLAAPTGDGPAASAATMGNAAERNVISGNSSHGVRISGAGTDLNVVAGNFIGTDVTGTVALGNGGVGVYLLDGVQSNVIGSDGDGLADEAERNVISGNLSHGVLITGTGTDLNVVAGNYLGTDATGTLALGNGFGVEYGAGVAVFGGAQSNRIGTDGNGVADAAERNVISGNSNKGVSIAYEGTSDNVVAGNYIGTDVTGTVALGNGADGVKIWWAANQRIGGSKPGEGNLISGNARFGVFIQGAEASSNLVQGNYIGTDVFGTGALGNGSHGVFIVDGAHLNTVGGDAASGNVIAWNAGAGVAVVGEDTTGNRIQANSIHDNGGLGIDLGDDGVTPNAPTHGDGTPSPWQNYPVIAAALVGASTRVIGTLHSPANAEYTLDFYANTAADPSGFGEGERWLGSAVVATDASGNAAFNVLLPVETTSGELITATATDADGNTSEFSAAQDARTVDLGTVAFEELLELDLSEGEIWFRLETCRAGVLTVEALYDPAAGTAELTLFDKHRHPLATSSNGTGHERIDQEAGGAGEVFWIELMGTNPRVDLRLCNQVLRTDSRVSVYGTDGDDRFEFEAYVQPPGGPLGAVDHRVTINGVAYTFTLPTIPPPVLFVTFDGGGGDDTAVFHGSAGNDRVKLWPDRGRVDGFGYTVITKSVEAATAHGGGGADVAVLYDSQGPDAFTAGPDSAEMTGPGFALAVHGFPEVHAFASDDGQTDTATLEDRAGSRERFRAWPTEAKMCGLGFFNRAKGFDDVRAGASDAADVAEIHDSPGADAFEAYADRATMGYAGGSTVEAEGFRWLFAFASDDGQTDTARLYDTTADLGTSYATWFKGFNGVAKMYEVSTFYNRASDFDEVVASAVGGDDTAKLFDSPGPDDLAAYADQATMSYPDETTVRADDFRWVLAYGSDDGQVDTARLYDATADLGTSYATWFKADDDVARLYEDSAFYIQARDFDRVSATAVGDDDTAKLFDSALDDVYWSRPDHSRMEYADGTFAEALDFRYVLSYSRYGSDTATLYDETAGGTSYAARFAGYATWAKLYHGAFYTRTEGFAEVRAALGGDDDLAWLYDDPTRDDHLLVTFPGDLDHAAAKAKLWNDRRAIYVDDFHTLTASTSEDFEDDADVDPAYEDDVILEGYWADP